MHLTNALIVINQATVDLLGTEVKNIVTYHTRERSLTALAYFLDARSRGNPAVLTIYSTLPNKPAQITYEAVGLAADQALPV